MASSTLSFDLTPPRVANKLSSLSPHTYIREPALLQAMRDKSLLHISSRAQQDAYLDPLPTAFDTNIMEYHSRTRQISDVDRKKLRVLILINQDMLRGVSDVRY